MKWYIPYGICHHDGIYHAVYHGIYYGIYYGIFHTVFTLLYITGYNDIYHVIYDGIYLIVWQMNEPHMMWYNQGICLHIYRYIYLLYA